MSVLYTCSVMQPMEAFLLLISSSPFGLQGATLTFRLKTHVSHIAATVSISQSIRVYVHSFTHSPINQSILLSCNEIVTIM